jgi:hypothetical protein
MSRQDRWMIFGVYGATARLVVQEALALAIPGVSVSDVREPRATPMEAYA